MLIKETDYFWLYLFWDMHEDDCTFYKLIKTLGFWEWVQKWEITAQERWIAQNYCEWRAVFCMCRAHKGCCMPCVCSHFFMCVCVSVSVCVCVCVCVCVFTSEGEGLTGMVWLPWRALIADWASVCVENLTKAQPGRESRCTCRYRCVHTQTHHTHTHTRANSIYRYTVNAFNWGSL